MAATISTDCKNQISIHSSSPCLEPDSVSISSKNFSENVPSSANNQSTKLAFENSCQAAQLLAIILELLTFCIEHHAYHIRTYLLQKKIVRRIMMLTKSRHTFLVLSKFFRFLLQPNI